MFHDTIIGSTKRTLNDVNPKIYILDKIRSVLPETLQVLLKDLRIHKDDIVDLIYGPGFS